MPSVLCRRIPVVVGRVLVLAMLSLLVASTVEAVPPIFHGRLTAGSGKGRIDPNTGNTTFSIRRWGLKLTSDSNGIDPAVEVMIIAVAEESFRIPEGMLKRSRSGRRFTYRTTTNRGVRMIQLTRDAEGGWRIRFTLAGVELSSLLVLDPPLCLPLAVIVGDDDGFTGVSFDKPKPYPSSVLTIRGVCSDVVGWPWA